MESTQIQLVKQMICCGYVVQHDISRISYCQSLQYIAKHSKSHIIPIELLMHKMSMNYLRRTETSPMHWLPLPLSHGHLLTKNKGKPSHKTQYKDFALKGNQRLGIDKWYENKHKRWEDGIRDQSEESAAIWEEGISHGDTTLWAYWNENM